MYFGRSRAKVAVFWSSLGYVGVILGCGHDKKAVCLVVLGNVGVSFREEVRAAVS